MIQFRSLAVATAAIALIASAPAIAVVKVATYSGTLIWGYDYAGVFGPANTDLTGAKWVVTFTYDKTLGQYQDTVPGESDQSQGGSATGFGSPVISNKMKINGVTRSVSRQHGRVETSMIYGYGSTYHEFYETFTAGNIETANGFFMANNFDMAPTSLDQNFGPVTTPFNDNYGEIFYTTYDYLTGDQVYQFDSFLDGDVTFSVSDPVPDTGAVPEPASWALMIAGFGLVGTAQRRVLRRRVVAVTA